MMGANQDAVPREPSGLSLQIQMFNRLCDMLPPDEVQRRCQAELARREREEQAAKAREG